MHYPVDTPQQLRAVLRALRRSRQLTQLQLGRRLGVNQKRIARIEAAPQLTGFDQIARLVAALGGRLLIDVPVSAETAEAQRQAAPPLAEEPRVGDTW